MVRIRQNGTYFTDNGSQIVLVDVFCKSTDAKPTAKLATGSRLVEVDTGKVYLFDETSGWVEQFSLQR